MNRIVTFGTLFLTAIMLIVGTAVAFPIVSKIISQPADITQNDTSTVESAQVSDLLNAGAVQKHENLLVALAEDQPVPQIPFVAAPTAKSEPLPTMNWAMKFVLGNSDAGIEHLSPIAVGSVKLIRKGEVVGSFSIGPGGIAQVPQLSSGVYSIVVRSVEGFSAIGTYLVQGDQKGEVTVKLALVPNQESIVIDSLLTRARDDRSNYVGIQKEYRYDGNTSLASRENQIERGADGVVRIRLLELLDQYGLAQTTEGLSVHFVLNKKIVSHGISDADGIAELQGIDNGRYAMVVTGQQRVLVISVLIKDRIGKSNILDSAVSLITNFVIGSVPVSINQSGSDSAAGTTPPGDYESVNQSMNVGTGGPGTPAGTGGSTFGGGGAGSGGGGSGGGGGGSGGGGGGLLGAAVGGAVGFLAGQQDDNGVVSPSL